MDVSETEKNIISAYQINPNSNLDYSEIELYTAEYEKYQTDVKNKLMEMLIRQLKGYSASKEIKVPKKMEAKSYVRKPMMLGASLVPIKEATKPIEYKRWIEDNSITNHIMKFLEEVLPIEVDEQPLSFFFILIRGSIPYVIKEGEGKIVERIRNLDKKLHQNEVYKKMIETY